MNNPYYEEKLKNLNNMLDKVKQENSEIEKQNAEITESLKELEKQIETNYEKILKTIEPLKAK